MCIGALFKILSFSMKYEKKNDTTIRVVFLFLLLFKQTVSNLFCGQPLRKTETNACKFLTSSYVNAVQEFELILTRFELSFICSGV